VCFHQPRLSGIRILLEKVSNATSRALVAQFVHPLHVHFTKARPNSPPAITMSIPLKSTIVDEANNGSADKKRTAAGDHLRFQ
jgi:hypothetical protein